MAEPLRRVGRYDLLEVIGRGGAAVVYLAHQPDLGRDVALKELAAHHAADPSFAQRFVEESRMAASMNHPSIVTVFEYFEDDGLPYIAMEYMSQGSLRGHLQQLSGAQLGGVLESVLEGLIYASRLGIVHRDLKPENLLVGMNGEVKIADFGVARALSSTTVRPYATVAGTPIGTPAYMAPEQAMAKPLTASADLYSLGIIAWEALAGRTPFGNSDTPMAVLYQQVNETIPPIETIRGDVHPGACEWLSKMLAKRPEARYGSAQEAWEDLDEVLIDMLGPRWRRGAALTGLDAPSLDVSTPTGADPFAGANRAASARTPVDEQPELSDEHGRPQTSAVLTPDPSRGRAPELDPFIPLTPLPQHEPVADYLHSFRTAAATQTRRRQSRSRSTTRVAAAGAVVVLAAAAGGVIGGSSGSDSSPAPVTPPVTLTTAAETRALAVRPVLSAIATETAKAVKGFHADKTQKTQAKSALTVSERYASAAKQLRNLPSTDQSPALKGVERAASDLSVDWRAVRYDSLHPKPGAYLKETGKIRQAETQLADDATVAERG